MGGVVFFFNDTATTEIYTLSLHDALPISEGAPGRLGDVGWIRERIRGRIGAAISREDIARGRIRREFRLPMGRMLASSHGLRAVGELRAARATGDRDGTI